MSEREFLIQRYAGGNWPYVRGQIPFIATGPAFKQFVVPGSLERYGEYRFRTIREIVADIAGPGDWRETVAEWLLREGIVEALWSVDVTTCLLPEQRWEASISSLADEIPKSMPLDEAVIELLSGLPSAADHRSYLSEDDLSLEPVVVPS